MLTMRNLLSLLTTMTSVFFILIFIRYQFNISLNVASYFCMSFDVSVTIAISSANLIQWIIFPFIYFSPLAFTLGSLTTSMNILNNLVTKNSLALLLCEFWLWIYRLCLYVSSSYLSSLYLENIMSSFLLLSSSQYSGR